MGFLNKLFGGGKKSAPSTTTTVQRNYPEWVDTEGKEAFQKVKNYANSPIEQYNGPRIAPLSDTQQDWLRRIKSIQGQYNPEINQNKARFDDLYNQKAQRFDEANFNGYLNPYMEKIYNPLAEQINEAAGAERAKMERIRGLSGQRGSSRSAFALKELEKERLNQLRQLGGETFEKAARMFSEDEARIMADRQRKQQVVNDILKAISQQHGIGMDELAQLAKGGEMERLIAQAQIDAEIQKIAERQQEERQRMELLSNALRGVPSTTQTSTQTQSGGAKVDNTMQNVAAAANAAATIASLFSSDLRIKENIVKVGEKNGINIYEFNYINSPKRYRGVIAQEVEHIPNTVHEIDGIKYVDFSKLPIQMEIAA